MKNEKSVCSVLVFGRNNNEDISDTIRAVINASSKANVQLRNFILVDDGSRLEMIHNLPHDMREYLTAVIRHDHSLGISDAINSGIRFCKDDKVMILPGHNVFTEEAIQKAFELAPYWDLVLGFRSNLFRERPLLKIINSLIFRVVFRWRISPWIIDPHGLPVYRVIDVLNGVENSRGHAVHVSILKGVLKNNALNYVQFPAPITEGHSKRKSRSKKDNFPSTKAMYLTLLELLVK